MKLVELACLAFLSIPSHADLPSNYNALSATKKRETLWSRIQSSRYEIDELPEPDIDSMLNQMMSFMEGDAKLDSLRATLTHAGDELPATKSGKFIHPFGTVIQVKYVPIAENPTLGILGKKDAAGIIRLSLAGPYLEGLSAFIPGIALKLFQDGKPSLNLMAMQRLEGQGDDTFFFRHELSTAIPLPEVPPFPLNPLEWLAASRDGFRGLASHGIKTKAKLNTYFFLKHFQRKFERATDGRPANILPMVHLVETGTPIYKIVLRPTQAVKEAYLSSRQEDYRMKIGDIKAGTALFDVVYFRNQESRGVIVGTLISESSAIASSYGDDILFFQHHFPKR